MTAIDGADFDLYPGEILAVIGDNGAGKSSMIKALSGATIPDEGEIRLDGEVVNFKSPHDARSAGIETVYQDLAVAAARSTSRPTCSSAARSGAPSYSAASSGWSTTRGQREEAVKQMKALQIGILLDEPGGGDALGCDSARASPSPAAAWARKRESRTSRRPRSASRSPARCSS